MTPPPLPVLPLGTVAGESQLNEESTPGTFTLIIASNFFFLLTKTIWQTEFTLEMFLGPRILRTTGLFFSLSD